MIQSLPPGSQQNVPNQLTTDNYGHFHGSALKSVWRRVNQSLIGWLMRKHKKLAGHKTRAAETLQRLAQRRPRAFVHWSMGYLS